MYKSQKCHNALQWGKMLPEGVLLIFIQILIIGFFRIKVVNGSNVRDKYFKFSRENPKVINTRILTPPCLLARELF